MQLKIQTSWTHFRVKLNHSYLFSRLWPAFVRPWFLFNLMQCFLCLRFFIFIWIVHFFIDFTILICVITAAVLSSRFQIFCLFYYDIMLHMWTNTYQNKQIDLCRVEASRYNRAFICFIVFPYLFASLYHALLVIVIKSNKFHIFGPSWTTKPIWAFRLSQALLTQIKARVVSKQIWKEGEKNQPSQWWL